MDYLSTENKVKEIAVAFRHARTDNRRSMHSEVVKAVLYLQSIFGDDAIKIDMIIELARKASRYDLEAE